MPPCSVLSTTVGAGASAAAAAAAAVTGTPPAAGKWFGGPTGSGKKRADGAGADGAARPESMAMWARWRVIAVGGVMLRPAGSAASDPAAP